MNDIPLMVWLEILRSKVGTGDTKVALSIINELLEKLQKKNGVPTI